MGYGQPFDNVVVTVGGTNFDGSAALWEKAQVFVQKILGKCS